MSELDPANLNKLKVTELRDELKTRGLETKGTKPVLVKRLKEALVAAEGDGGEVEEAAAGSGGEEEQEEEEEEELDQSASAEPESQQDSEVMKTESEEPEDAQVQQSEPVAKADETVEEPPKAQEAAQPTEPESDQKKEQMEHSGLAESEQNQSEEPAAAAAAEDAGDGEEAEFQITDAVGDDNEQPEADQKQEERRGHKRRHSRSRSRSPRRRSPAAKQPREEAKDDWVTTTTVMLDRFNCDLNVRIDDGYKCSPVTVEGFAFMWAGVRANYGVNKGKVSFAVKIKENLNVDHLPPEEVSRHVVRVGFSTDDTSLQLGEEKFSYGYGGTGKSSTDCKFQNYGQEFGEGDVVTASVDFESDPVKISFAKNAEDLGTCYEIPLADLEGKALFPHILSKNCEFNVDFGQQEEPFFPLAEGFTFINNIPEADRVRGALPPAKKEDCEIIMMCGLPGAGKTVYANKYALENAEKRFVVLGTNNIIDKMKVMGLPRKRNYSGRWDMLIDKSTKCLNRMLEIAAKRKSNYILDQTNVYPNAQRRKMRPFEGFQRKAVVIVPSDEEYKNRCAKREKEEGKEVPDSAVLEMKANFKLPEEGQLFDKVEYIELEKDEAVKLIEKYNKEGQDALPPEKRFRGNEQRTGFQNRDRYTAGGSFQGGRDNRYDNRSSPRGGGYQDKYDRRSGGGGQPVERRGGERKSWGDSRGGGGGWKDYGRYDSRSRSQSGGQGSYDNRSRSSGSYSSGGGGGGKWSGQQGGSGSWGSHGSNQGSYNQQGSWGSGSGGNQQWGNQQWGNQGWSGSTAQQWSNYNQQYPNWNQSGYNQGSWNYPQSSYPQSNQTQGQGQGSWGSYSSGSGYTR